MAQGTNKQQVVWYEGMMLDPHHFQQFDRYQQGLFNQRMRAISPFDWGLTEFVINKEALANGQFSLLRCSGIMSDGLTFNIPENNSIPGTRNLQEFMPAAEDQITALLALPIERLNGKNCLLDAPASGDTIRFRSETILVNDVNTGTNERQVTVAQPNFQVRFSSQPLENFTVLPLAQIKRVPSGYQLNEEFIPVCLAISASDRLVSITNSLLELLITNRAHNWDRHHQKFSAAGEFTTADLETSWLVFIMNNFIPTIQHYFSTRNQHPAELYRVMAALAGQLTTFSFNSRIHPRDFPKYDHHNLTTCFNQFEKIIRDLLNVKVSTGPGEIRLERREETLLVGQIKNVDQISTPQLYLQCSGEIPEQKMIQDLPRTLRIAALQDLPNLEHFALPGLNLSYSARPPLGLPIQSDLHYFRLEKVGRLWDAILNNLSIAIRIPPGFSGIQIKLFAMSTSESGQK